MRPRNPQELAEAARMILERQKAVDPRARFEKMVESGLIDAEGRLTKESPTEAPVWVLPRQRRPDETDDVARLQEACDEAVRRGLPLYLQGVYSLVRGARPT